MRPRRRFALAALAALIILGAAATWFGPSLVNPERWRGHIAALAGRALGGSAVRIAGPIRFALLPEAQLTAADVTVTGRNGGSLTARALRLRLALVPLLAGRLQAETLTLAGADWRLPWPETLRPTALRPPPWLGEVEADIEDGRISVGRLAITAIDGQAATDRLTGTLTASGEGRIEGQLWHFAFRLSRPGADGAAALDLALDGAGPLAGTAARFSGQMAANGTLAGALRGHGVDLGALLPVPHLAWRGSGRLRVAQGLAVADRLELQLGAAPARGAIALRLGATPRLDLTLRIGQIDLAAWLAALGQRAGRMPLTTGIDLSAEAARLGGADLRRLQARLDLTPSGFALHDASAGLPGRATLWLRGAAAHGRFQGAARLDAPDAPATWRWLAPLAGIPPGLPAPRAADLSATVTVVPGRVALDRIQGTVDGGRVGGSLVLRPGARPGIEAQVSVDTLDLDGVNPAGADAARRAAAAVDLSLRLRADAVRWGDMRASDLALDAASDPSGLRLRQLALELHGAALSASGQLGNDGAADARVELTAANAQGLGALLPEKWRPPGLFHSAAHLELTASGKPTALATRLHLVLGALRLDASPTIDLPAGTATGAVSLGAPDARGLLSALELPPAGWLGPGELALHGTVSTGPERSAADDLIVTAGALRVSGKLALGWSGSGPHLSGTLDAASLPLPWPALRGNQPLGLLAAITAHPAWSGTLRIAAAKVLDGPATVLHDASGRVTLGAGTLRLDSLAADLAGGRLEGTLMLNAAQTPPRLAVYLHVIGAHVTSPVLGLPLDLAAARQASAALDATASGYSSAALLATLAGQVEASAKDGTVTGFDLPALHAAVGGDPRQARAGATKALAGEASPFTSLQLAAKLDHGNLTLERGQMTAPDGTASLAGTVALAPAALDLRLSLHPAGEDMPEIGVLLSGSQAAPQRVPELAELAAWLAAHR